MVSNRWSGWELELGGRKCQRSKDFHSSHRKSLMSDDCNRCKQIQWNCHRKEKCAAFCHKTPGRISQKENTGKPICSPNTQKPFPLHLPLPWKPCPSPRVKWKEWLESKQGSGQKNNWRQQKMKQKTLLKLQITTLDLNPVQQENFCFSQRDDLEENWTSGGQVRGRRRVNKQIWDLLKHLL